jgi:hypothetical protein
MAIKIRRTWETIYFVSTKKGFNDQTVELSINRETKKYTLCTAHEEAVSFNNDKSIEESEMKLEALKEAFKYIKQELK